MVGLAGMGAVHCREPVAQGGPVGEQLGRAPAVRGEALLVLGRLLRDVGMQWRAPLGRPRGDDLDRRRVDRAHRVDRRADPHARSVGERRRPRRPPQGVAVREPALGLVDLDADATAQVARVEQGEADARLGGGGDQGGAHRVGVVVRLAAGPMVEIVELPDGRDPGPHHLGERRPGQPVIPRRDRASPPPRTSAPATSRTTRRPAGVRPRSARWKAWLWALAKPGTVSPANRVAPAAGSAAPGSTAVMRAPSTRTSTSRSARSPPNHASSQW